MPGSTRSMQLEHVLRNVQTDRGSLLHGRLLRWQFDTVTLAHRMPSGAVHPITQLSRSQIGIANGSCGGIRAPSESAFLLDGPSSRTPFDRALISDGDQRGYRTPA